MEMDFSREISSLLSYLSKYIGFSFGELARLTNMNSASKSKNALLARRIADSYKGEQFCKALLEHESISLKTVELDIKGRPKESMSFPAMDFDNLIHEDWENSKVRSRFSKPFLFFVFQRTPEGEKKLIKVFLWSMPETDLDESVRAVWERTKEILESGQVVNRTDSRGRIILNFPKEKDTKVCHVRPHGRDSMDLDKLPTRDQKTNYIGLAKQSFWLNKNYIGKIIETN